MNKFEGFNSEEEKNAAFKFNQQQQEQGEKEITSRLSIEIHDGRTKFISINEIPNNEHEDIKKKILEEISKREKDYDPDGFMFIDEETGKKYSFNKIFNNKMTSATETRFGNNLINKEKTTEEHEKKHVETHEFFEQLEKNGELSNFVDNVIKQLQEENIWEKLSIYILKTWPLISIGINDNDLQQRLQKQFENKTFNLNDFLENVKIENEEKYLLLLKHLVDEIISIAAEQQNKKRDEKINGIIHKAKLTTKTYQEELDSYLPIEA